MSVKGQVGEASREISFPQVRLISHWEFWKGVSTIRYLDRIPESSSELLSLNPEYRLKYVYLYNLLFLIAGMSCKYHVACF